jgi:hypothetical protein
LVTNDHHADMTPTILTVLRAALTAYHCVSDLQQPVLDASRNVTEPLQPAYPPDCPVSDQQATVIH